MTLQAKAVVFTRPHTVEFQDVTCPDPAADEAVVRITHSWISNGTEGSFLRGERRSGDTPWRPGDPMPYPIVAGYQKVGVVEQVGREIHDLKPGDTVFCTVGRIEGMFDSYAGHVSPSISPRSQLWKLPASIDPVAFSGLVLTQVGYNIGSRAPIGPGQYAVVVGDGLVGQWAAQTLASRGAKVIMIGQEPDRLAHMERLTWGKSINMKTTDWVAAVRKLAPNGVMVMGDAVGSREATEKIMDLMGHQGHIVSAGFCGLDDKISLQALRTRELSLDSVSGWTTERIDQTLKLVADGVLQTLPLITHHFPVAQADRAWQVITARQEPVLGVILDW
jgi:bacteriochlorophyllide a dehydrogenase